MTIKPLLFYMRAADYPEIEQELKKIPCDKFITNYMPYPFPHDLAREFFLEHTEYDYLIVQPQDLLFTKSDFEKLMLELNKNDFDVLSCVCNVERMGHPNHFKMAICKKIPSLDRLRRVYNWIPNGDLGIIEIEFQGMVCAAIHRRIIQRKTIDGEWFFKGTVHKGTGQFLAAPDLTFAHVCKNNGIKQYADTRIKLIHYANHKPNLVGIKEASTTFIKFDDN